MSKISKKQLIANQKNAKLGGVKTDNGKSITRFNALKHGILRESVSKYECLDYEIIYKALEQDFDPQNILEEIMVERITIAYIKLMRVAKAESELMKSAMDPTIKEEWNPLEFETRSGYEPVVTKDHMYALATNYARYETAIENRLYKAIDKLLELRNLNEQK